VRQAAALAHGRHRLAGHARHRLCRALWHEALGGVALDLYADRDDRALSQRLRAGHPELPQDRPTARAGPERAAERAALRRRPGPRAGIFCHRDYRRGTALPPGVRPLYISPSLAAIGEGVLCANNGSILKTIPRAPRG